MINRRRFIVVCAIVIVMVTAQPISSQISDVNGWINLDIPSPQRGNMGYAYDSKNQQGVIFGGDGCGGTCDDTFLWNGKYWKEVILNSKPSSRQSIQMTYDAARSEVIFFGGWTFPDKYFGDTWTFNGAVWTLKNTPGPPTRANNALAYDKERQIVVLFGGSLYQTIYGDTWEWDGTNWKQVSNSGPSPRIFSRMVYDEVRKKMVLFGGATKYPGTVLNDTWEWDGNIWHQVATSGPSPSPRLYHQMAYDPIRKKVILYGGLDEAISKTYDDTWEWDGSKWTKINANSAGLRLAGAIFFDDIRGYVILSGGYGNGGLLNDTWTYLPLETTTSTPLALNTPTATTNTPKIASTPLQTPGNTQNLNPTKKPLTTEPSVTSSPSKSETNWTLLGGAIFAILLIGAVILRSRESKESTPKSFEKSKPDEKSTPKDTGIYPALEYKSKGNTNQASTELLIKRGYSVHPNNDIKFGIRLDNNTNLVIIDTDVILDYDTNLFSTHDSDLQHVGNIMPNSARTVTYLLKPLGCIHNEQINALITYKDHTGKKQTIHMRSKEVHCVCPFLKEKPMSEGEYSRLAASSDFIQEGISFKGISVEELAKFMGDTCRHMLHKVREYDIEDKKVIYLSGESVGEKTYYLLTAVIQNYKGLTQVVLRAHSDMKYGLNGFMNEMADSLRHLVGSVQNAKEIGIIENTQVINIIDSVVQRTNFNINEGTNSKNNNIKNSIVQRPNISTGARNCPNCGREVDANETFCMDCGARL